MLVKRLPFHLCGLEAVTLETVYLNWGGGHLLSNPRGCKDASVGLLPESLGKHGLSEWHFAMAGALVDYVAVV